MCNLPVRKKAPRREINNQEAGTCWASRAPVIILRGRSVPVAHHSLPSTLTPSSVTHPHLLCPAPDEVLPASCPPLPNRCTCTRAIVHTQTHAASCAHMHARVPLTPRCVSAATFAPQPPFCKNVPVTLVSRCAMKFTISLKLREEMGKEEPNLILIICGGSQFFR